MSLFGSAFCCTSSKAKWELWSSKTSRIFTSLKHSFIYICMSVCLYVCTLTKNSHATRLPSVLFSLYTSIAVVAILFTLSIASTFFLLRLLADLVHVTPFHNEQALNCRLTRAYIHINIETLKWWSWVWSANNHYELNMLLLLLAFFLTLGDQHTHPPFNM